MTIANLQPNTHIGDLVQMPKASKVNQAAQVPRVEHDFPLDDDPKWWALSQKLTCQSYAATQHVRGRLPLLALWHQRC